MTFNNFERNGTARWSDHELIQNKSRSQFEAPGLEEVTYTVLLKAELGINPLKQIEKLREMKDTGKTAQMLIGRKPISQNQWSIQSMRERYNTIDNQGNILSAEVDLSLKEYVIKKKATKSKKPAPKTSSTPSKAKKALGKITIKVKSVHIRSGPTTSAKVVGYAYKGNTLPVYSMGNGWYSLGQGKYITANAAYSTLKKG